MDFFELISSLVASLAWPLVIFFVIKLFREELKALIRRLKGIKIGDKSVELGIDELDRDMRNAVNKAEQSGVRVEISSNTEQPTPNLLDQAEQIITIAPAAAIMLAWKAIEERLHLTDYRVINDFYGNCRMPENRTWRGLLRAHRQHLDPSSIDLLAQLRKIRNEAVHKFDRAVPPDTAAYYVATAKGLMEKLNSTLPDDGS